MDHTDDPGFLQEHLYNSQEAVPEGLYEAMQRRSQRRRRPVFFWLFTTGVVALLAGVGWWMGSRPGSELAGSDPAIQSRSTSKMGQGPNPSVKDQATNRLDQGTKANPSTPIAKTDTGDALPSPGASAQPSQAPKPVSNPTGSSIVAETPVARTESASQAQRQQDKGKARNSTGNPSTQLVISSGRESNGVIPRNELSRGQSFKVDLEKAGGAISQGKAGSASRPSAGQDRGFVQEPASPEKPADIGRATYRAAMPQGGEDKTKLPQKSSQSAEQIATSIAGNKAEAPSLQTSASPLETEGKIPMSPVSEAKALDLIALPGAQPKIDTAHVYALAKQDTTPLVLRNKEEKVPSRWQLSVFAGPTSALASLKAMPGADPSYITRIEQVQTAWGLDAGVALTRRLGAGLEAGVAVSGLVLHQGITTGQEPTEANPVLLVQQPDGSFTAQRGAGLGAHGQASQRTVVVLLPALTLARMGLPGLPRLGLGLEAGYAPQPWGGLRLSSGLHGALRLRYRLSAALELEAVGRYLRTRRSLPSQRDTQGAYFPVSLRLSLRIR